MAVTSATSSISYTGNASTTTSYAVPFVFLENAHLAAIAKVTATGAETAVTLTNHTGAGDPSGGTVRTAVAVPATSTLTIFRTVPATQTTSYSEGGDFPAASHERALDKLTFLSQQNERAVERSFRVTEGSGTKNEVVAVPNTLIGLDSSNQPKAMTLSEVKTYLALSGVTLDVNAGMKTFSDAGERALAVPEFAGQLGTQRDTADIYISTGTAAGNWSLVEENMSLADFTSGFFTADATGRGKFATGFVDSGVLSDNAVTTAKINNNAVTTAKVLNANITPAKLSQPLTFVGAVATNSGIAIDFFGIPSWARLITVVLNQVSTDGTGGLIIQLGEAGSGFKASGYAGTGTAITGTNACGIASFTAGFNAGTGSLATSSRSGCLFLANVGTNTWIASGALTNGTIAAGTTAGVVVLDGTLDRVRLTTIGADTFDQGSINISYEG